jgi:hypothetical protein
MKTPPPTRAWLLARTSETYLIKLLLKSKRLNSQTPRYQTSKSSGSF